jgi:hypothetical protein
MGCGKAARQLRIRPLFSTVVPCPRRLRRVEHVVSYFGSFGLLCHDPNGRNFSRLDIERAQPCLNCARQKPLNASKDVLKPTRSRSWNFNRNVWCHVPEVREIVTDDLFDSKPPGDFGMKRIVNDSALDPTFASFTNNLEVVAL